MAGRGGLHFRVDILVRGIYGDGLGFREALFGRGSPRIHRDVFWLRIPQYGEDGWALFGSDLAQLLEAFALRMGGALR